MSPRKILLIPSEISERGLKKLQAELQPYEVKILDTRDNLVLVEWDDKVREALASELSIQSALKGRISYKALQKMPPKVRRLGTLWNWSYNKRGRKVSGGEVKRIMKTLQLEVRDKNVYDLKEKKNIGTIEEEESEEKKSGSWCLYQQRGWYRIPGWFGYWEKLWCRSTVYKYYPQCSGTRKVADYISAEVDGPQHDSWAYRRTASTVYTEDWDYIWVGESHCGTAFSYARIGSGRASITRRIC